MTRLWLYFFIAGILATGLLIAAPGKVIEDIGGLGKPGFSGNSIPATVSLMNNPYGLVIGPDGALYICEIGNHRVRRLDVRTENITTVAGNGKKGYDGDGGPATLATLNEPYEVRFDKAGDMYFVEMQNHVVRRVDHKTGFISTIAGTGAAGFSGDGGPAAKAQLRQPHSIAFDPQGGLLICDIGNNRIRRVDLVTGIISTYAGNGDKKPVPDGAPLEGSALNGPRAIALDPEGNLFVALREGNSVVRIDPKQKRIFLVAGTGEKGYTGDGGDAKKAKLSGPKGISYAPDNSLYIADTESHTIRRIDLKTNVITTIVGTGERGDGPVGDPRKCKLSRPHGIFVDKDGTIYIGDSESHKVRMVH